MEAYPDLFMTTLEEDLNFRIEPSLLEYNSNMSYLDMHNTPMTNYKEEYDPLYGNMNNQDNYSLQNTSNFSNMLIENPNPLNFPSDNSLNNFDIDFLNDNHQTHLYPCDENKPIFNNDLNSSYSNTSFSTSNYNKSLSLNNMGNLYTDNSTLPSPYYNPISQMESPCDQLVPNIPTPEYSFSYDATSPMGSFMNDTSSPSTSTMNTAQLVTAVYGETSDKQSPQERVPIVWHFLLRLLANPQYNPSIICWDNIGEHTFRLINPDAVASLWGKRLGKPTLTRNNFARTLRYHYSNGALNPISEQHVYQLGKKAIDYLHEKARFCI
ncbi:unnamed protein product [Meganyctiphanes norvegica]|uniref:ETS domain-containing protein n=1 Tax=Meganyctiphanes norvegica TaxID=48144 RepID=A0AAV2PSZ1_MEGNR